MLDFLQVLHGRRSIFAIGRKVTMALIDIRRSTGMVAASICKAVHVDLCANVSCEAISSSSA